jgi:hypothetical protein
MPVELVEYLEATQTSLTASLEFIVQLFAIVGCATLVFCLASIAWLSYCEARQSRLREAAGGATYDMQGVVPVAFGDALKR